MLLMPRMDPSNTVRPFSPPEQTAPAFASRDRAVNGGVPRNRTSLLVTTSVREPERAIPRHERLRSAELALDVVEDGGGLFQGVEEREIGMCLGCDGVPGWPAEETTGGGAHARGTDKSVDPASPGNDG